MSDIEDIKIKKSNNTLNEASEDLKAGNNINSIINSSYDNLDVILNLNIENYIKIVFSELISGKNILFSGKSKRDIIKNTNLGFGEEKYPGIGLLINKKIKIWLEDKKSKGISIDQLIKNELSKSVENFISGIVRELELDFCNPENMGLQKNINSSKDIPIQAGEAKKSGVKNKYNGTIGVLKDTKGNTVSNDRINEVLQKNLGDINNLLNYQPGVGIESFRKTIELLIKYEQEIYNWPTIKGEVTRPYFIPGGGGGLTLFRDYFLNEGDLVLLPNYRWPNIDGIIMNKTKVMPAEIDLINKDGSLNLSIIDESIQNSIKVGRKKISIYLNFPNNPTGVKFNNFNKVEFNKILSKYSNDDISIQIILDDPYGAFSIANNDKQKIDSPLSYNIDTSKNVTLFELGSHGTKEAGVYGLRIGVLRVFGNNYNIDNIDKKIQLAIRETFSMSPSIQQVIMIKAILGNDIDPFNINQINDLSEKELNNRIGKYIEGRNTMLSKVYPKLELFKNEIIFNLGEYLLPMENKYNGESQNGGFMLAFTLTNKAKILGINFPELQKICFNNLDGDIDNRCAFTVFDDNLNTKTLIRISLIGGNIKEYTNRLKLGIEKLIEIKKDIN